MLSLNPWIILAVILGLGAGGVGLYVKGRSDGRQIEFAQRATLDEVARVSREAGLQAAAEAISKQKVIHTTIRGKVEREVIREKVYSDCVHPDNTLRLLNDALTNRSQPVGDSSVPESDTP